MKVCMLLKNNFTHDARVYKEAKTLVNAGYGVTIIAIKSDTTEEFENIEGIKIKRITVKESRVKNVIKDFFKVNNDKAKSTKVIIQKVGVNSKSKRKAFNSFRKWMWKLLFELEFIKAAIKEKANIYHSHELLTLFHGYVASRVNKSKLVYDAHELQSELVTTYSRRPKFEKFKCEIIEKIFIKKAHKVITVSESIGSVLAKRYKIKFPIILMNCPPLIDKNTRAKPLKKLLGIEDSKKIVIYQGNFTPDKGIEKLIDVASYLGNAVLVLIGDGVSRRLIETRVKESNLQQKVFLLGRVPNRELLTYTISADIGIHILPNSSLNSYYALPNKLFEYLTVGLPVVASNFPEIQKVVKEFNVGKVVDSWDHPSKIALAITEILEDKELYKLMSNNAKKITRTTYNWENESKKLLNLYNDCKVSAVEFEVRI